MCVTFLTSYTKPTETDKPAETHRAFFLDNSEMPIFEVFI